MDWYPDWSIYAFALSAPIVIIGLPIILWVRYKAMATIDKPTLKVVLLTLGWCVLSIVAAGGSALSHPTKPWEAAAVVFVVTGSILQLVAVAKRHHNFSIDLAQHDGEGQRAASAMFRPGNREFIESLGWAQILTAGICAIFAL